MDISHDNPFLGSKSLHVPELWFFTLYCEQALKDFSQWLTRYDEIMRTRAIRDDVLSPLFLYQNRGISTHDIHRIQRASKIKDSVSCTVCLDPIIWLLYAYVSVGMSHSANKHNSQISVCWWSANLIVAW